MSKFTFSKIEWGEDDAMADDNIANYFVDIPDFLLIKSGIKRYVLGRKGTGKSAIAKKIMLDAKNNPLEFAKIISLRSFPIQQLKELRDKNYKDKSQYVSVWKFLILVEMAKMLCEMDNGAGPADKIEALKEFIGMNFPGHGCDIVQTMTILKENNRKISFGALFKDIISASVEGSWKNSKTSSVVINFESSCDYIISILRDIKTDSLFYLMFDELDEGYKSGDDATRLLLLALIRAVEDISISLGKKRAFIPIVMLRSDIFDRLEDNDLNKLDDNILRLDWTGSQGVRHSLLDVISKRIKYNFDDGSLDSMNSIDVWKEVASEPIVGQFGKGIDSSWGHIYPRTYDRPRDVIKYLKLCKKIKTASGNCVEKLNIDVLKSSEYQYSDWLYKEIKDEVHSHFPQWKNAIRCVSNIQKFKFKVDELKAKIDSDTELCAWLASNNKDYLHIIRFLFDFSVIGNMSSAKIWSFKYKDLDSEFNPSQELVVHLGMSKKLKSNL